MWFKSRKPAQPEPQPKPDVRVDIKNDKLLHTDVGIYTTQELNRYQAFLDDVFPHTLAIPGEFVMTLPGTGEQPNAQVLFKSLRQYFRGGTEIGWIYDGYLIENGSYAKHTHAFVVIVPKIIYEGF